MNDWKPICEYSPAKDFPEKSGKYLVTYLSPRGKRMIEERWFDVKYLSWTRKNGTPIAWRPMPRPYTGPELDRAKLFFER